MEGLLIFRSTAEHAKHAEEIFFLRKLGVLCVLGG